MSVVASGGADRDARLAGCGYDRHAQRGFTGLSALLQNILASNPFCGQVLVFPGRRGDLLKILWWDGTGLCLFTNYLVSYCISSGWIRGL